MKIITDLKAIEILAEEREDENMEFRAFLKQITMKDEEVDEIVHRIYDEVIKQIDCTQCGNCCKELGTLVSEKDIKRLAKGMGITQEECIRKYCGKIEGKEPDYELTGPPCPFLRDNKCVYYEYRPKECWSYPHLHKKEFTTRLFGVVSNYAVCPIVFNVYEQLKKELWHKSMLFDEFMFLDE